MKRRPPPVDDAGNAVAIKRRCEQYTLPTVVPLLELLCGDGQVRRVLFSMLCFRTRVMLCWWCVRSADTPHRIIRVKKMFTNAFCACATEAQKKSAQMYYIKKANLIFDCYEDRVDNDDF